MSFLTQLLTPFVFTIHLILVNFAAVAPLVCIWFEYHARKKNKPEIDKVGILLASQCINWLTYGMITGALLGCLMWLAGSQWFFDILLKQFPHKKLSYAVIELLFYYVCMGGYLSWWRRGRREATWQRIAHRLLAVMAATNLLYHFPPLFASVSYIAAHSDQWKDRVIDPATYRQLVMQGEILARTLHHWLASVAIVGVVLMGKSLKISRENKDSPHAHWIATRAAWLTLVVTALQFVVGLWFLMEMQTGPRSLIMGQDWVGTATFMLSIVAVFGLIHRLAAVAFGDYQRRDIIQAMALLMFIILLMTATLERSRKNIDDQTALKQAVPSGVSIYDNK